MKKNEKIFKYIFVLILIPVFLTGFFPASIRADDAYPRPKAGTFYFQDIMGTRNNSTTYYYSDHYFDEPGTVNNPHLRTMSLCVAMASFESYRPGWDYTNRCENFDALMRDIGYFSLYNNESFDNPPEEHSIGVAIASKPMIIDGARYTVMAVGIRGSNYEDEWKGNMIVGKEGPSYGFDRGKEQVLEAIRLYEEKYELKENVKIWISGFSRAGSVANLAAEVINRDPEAYHTSVEDIYCYTFETPRAEEKDHVTECPNVHNTVNPADLIVRLVPAEWNMSRVGAVQADNPEDYRMDDTVLPAPGSEEYARLRDTMYAHLMEIDPYLTYSVDNFTMYKYKTLPELSGDDFHSLLELIGKIDLKDPSTAMSEISFADVSSLVIDRQQGEMTQADFTKEFMGWLTSTLSASDRAVYSEKYEDSFGVITKLYMGVSMPVRYLMDVSFGQMLYDPEFYIYLGRIVVANKAKGILGEEESERRIKEAAEGIGRLYISYLNGNDVGFTEAAEEEFMNAVYPMTMFLKDAISDDYLNQDLKYLLTLANNTMPLMEAHYPEVCLAWLMTFDSYYE